MKCLLKRIQNYLYIINQIIEIGQWLGFESKSEVKIADGAVVDAYGKFK